MQYIDVLSSCTFGDTLALSYCDKTHLAIYSGLVQYWMTRTSYPTNMEDN